jgi:hypothetical protein
MAIQRTAPTSASNCMAGDLVRIVDARGSSYPQAAQLGPAIVSIAGGMFGRVRLENGEAYLCPDERVPEIMRAIGNMKLGAHAMVERISVDHPHELALVGLEYLQKIADVARARATDGQGQVNASVLKALLGEAAGSDLRKIVDELANAGIAVVEKVSTKTTINRTVVLTTDPEGVRNGTVRQGALTFISPEETVSGNEVTVYDPVRTREILLSTQSMAASSGSDTAANPAPATTNIMQLLGLEGTLSMEDISLDPGLDDDEPDAPAPR